MHVMICRFASSAAEFIPNGTIHVALMSHGGFRVAWKWLEMLVSMSHDLVQHEGLNSN